MNPGSPTRHFSAAPFAHTVFDDAAMLARIGTDLRDLYGDVENATLPSDLVRLAERVDASRRLEGEDGPAG